MPISIELGDLPDRPALCIATSGASLLADPLDRGLILLQPGKWLRLVRWCGEVEPLSEMPKGATVFGLPVTDGQAMSILWED